MPDQLGEKGMMFVVNPNVIYHYIEIIRAPFMGYSPSMLNYIVTFMFMLILLLLSNFLYKKYNSRIPYWI
jgi:ABC-type polysaccharide/polyol phosphate export permease